MVFVLIFFLLDASFYYVIKNIPAKQPDQRLVSLIQGKINADILVLGSSRAAHNILAEDIEKHTHSKTFNLGFRKTNVEFHLNLLRLYLSKNKKPKQLIYLADVPFMFDEKALVFRTDVFLPFVYYPEYKNLLIDKGELSKMAYFLNLARFSFHTATKLPAVSIENFTTLQGSNPLPLENYKGVGDHFVANKKAVISYRLIREFKELQKLCLAHQIEFYLVVPPNNQPLDKEFIKYIQSDLFSTSKYYLYQLNYSTIDNCYFYDESHLNKNGATVFTGELSEFLNQKSRK